MRKIVAGSFMSMDGVVESPDKWTFPYFNDEVAREIASQQTSSDTLLLGRVTYEEFADYWPRQAGGGDAMAEYMNNAPKLVVSTTLGEVDWHNSALIEGDMARELAKLKQQSGKDISVIGSPTLVRSLLREHLLDELRLLVNPVVIGTGKRLFDDWTEQMPMKLLDSRALATGVVALVYARDDAR